MSEFVKYMHVEKLGGAEVEGIELGHTYVFPKIDGTNASLWLKHGVVMGGSRNRTLSLENDNAGFLAWARSKKRIARFFNNYPRLRLYGEWLVPHTLKTYRENAWNNFYVFDVFNDETQTFLTYEAYQPLLEEFGIDYLAPLRIFKNADSSHFVKCLEINNFLIEDGQGTGEGVVIKNYDFYNQFGRQIWAKIITSEFKEKHHKEMGAPEIGHELVELKIVEKYITKHLVDKVVAKIEVESNGWDSKYIPRLLETVFYDLVKEETYEFLKEFKNPTINFKTLKAFTIGKIKELKPELF